MRNLVEAENWFKRARSNIERAKAGRISDGILYEDLCFDCQQAVEKSLKGLLAYAGVNFPWTHSISKLIELVEENDIDVPGEIKDSVILTVYAVITRYPGNQEIVDEGEYKEAVRIAEQVYNWVKLKVNE